jgi:hypothetical protein
MTTLVLVGTGMAHAGLLAQLARWRSQNPTKPQAHDELVAASRAGGVVLVAPRPSGLQPGLLQSELCGHAEPGHSAWDWQSLLQGSGVRHIPAHVAAVHTAARELELVDAAGHTQRLPFARLSINTEASISRQAIEQRIPGAKEHAVFAHPSEALLKLWPALAERVAGQAAGEPFRISVVGAGPSGSALAFACQSRWPNCAITLVGPDDWEQSLGSALRGGLARAYQGAGIHRLVDRCTSIQPLAATQDHQAVLLHTDSGLKLHTHAPLIAFGSAPAPWASSAAGLTDVWLTEPGASGWADWKAGPNLARAIATKQHPTHPTRNPSLLPTSRGRALGAFGPLALEATWLWAWHNRRETSLQQHFQPDPQR